MNKQKYQSGFAHLAIIIVLIVALLCILGFVYWQNFMQPKNTDTSQKTTVVDNNDKVSDGVVDETASWTKLDTEEFTMSIPDGWKLLKIVTSETGVENGLVITPYAFGPEPAQSLTYKKGIPGTVEISREPQEGGHGFISSLIIAYKLAYVQSNSGAPSLENQGYTKVSKLQTNSGVSVDKYYQHYGEPPVDALSESPIVNGTNEYYYSFNTGTYPVSIRYFIAPNGQDNNLTQLEQAIKTIVIK